METLELDAQEFGLTERQGGWRLALLVVRNVVRGRGGPRTVASATVKVSAREFAERSKTEASRVLRYLKGWERAAEAGVVPLPGELLPGQHLELDLETLPEWNTFFVTRRSASSGGRRFADEQVGLPSVVNPGEVTRVSLRYQDAFLDAGDKAGAA